MQRKDLKSPFSLILEIRGFRKNCLFDSLKSSKTYKCKSLQTLHPYLKYSFCNCVLISLRAIRYAVPPCALKQTAHGRSRKE